MTRLHMVQAIGSAFIIDMMQTMASVRESRGGRT